MSSSSGIWNYTYDDEGLRTTRTNGTKTYTYVYSGGLLRKMTVAGYTLIIRYGADGRPYSVQFGNAEYFYLLNAQGDVIGLVNYEGTQVVAYTYDAWGNILSTTGTMASTLGQYNPLRYRSYVYDQETGLYYLQSRYYNPEWGRFINADSILDTRSFVGLNLFAYCLNNPVIYADPSGHGVFDSLLEYLARCASIYNQQQVLDTQIRMKQNELIRDGLESAYNAYNDSIIRDQQIQNQITTQQLQLAKTAAGFAWNAYMRGYELQQQAQLLQAQLILDGGQKTYHFLDDTGTIDAGVYGYHAYQAVNEGKKAAVYLALPAPTPVDESLAVWHAINSIYHGVMAGIEVFQ